MAVNPYALDLSGLQQGMQVGQQLRGLQDVRGQRRAARQQMEQEQALMGLLQQTDLTDPQQAQALATQFPGQLEQIREQQSFAMEQLQITDEYKQQASEKEKRDVNRAANNMLFTAKTRDTDAMVQSVRNNSELIIETTGNPMMVDVLENLAVNDPDQFTSVMQDIVIQTGGEPPTAKQMGTGEMAGYVFNPDTGTFSIDQDIKQELFNEAERKRQKGGELTFSEITTLQDKVGNIINDPIKVRGAAKNLERLREISPENRAAQVGVIYSFIKTLDPQGVVRESEQGMLASAGGPAESFAAMINRLSGQGPLTPGMIDEIVQTGQTLANRSIDGAEEALVDYLNAYGDTVDHDLKNRMYNRLPSPFAMDQPPQPDPELIASRPPPPPNTPRARGEDGREYYFIDNQLIPVEEFQQAQPVQRSGPIPVMPRNYTIADL